MEEEALVMLVDYGDEDGNEMIELDDAEYLADRIRSIASHSIGSDQPKIMFEKWTSSQIAEAHRIGEELA